MRDGGRFQVQKGGQFLHAVTALGQQTNHFQAVGIRQGFEESDQFFAHFGLQ